jgi:hypothetical protein
MTNNLENKMSNAEFNIAMIAACHERLIGVNIALEDEEVYQAYKEKDLEKLIKALDNNF